MQVRYGEEVIPKPFTIEELVTIQLSKAFFWYFLDHVYIRSFDGETYIDELGEEHPYTFGRLHREWAILAQYNPRLCVMAPRNHLKSTVLSKAYAFWEMFRIEDHSYVDILYLSYKADLANTQIKHLVREIKANPYTRFWRNLKKQSETHINYLVDYGDGPIGEVFMQGAGITSAIRGLHPKVTICDDILSDFSNPLSSSELANINRIFRQAVMSLPSNPTDPLILVGTPQSYDDILYEMSKSEQWLWLIYPAIIDDITQKVQWPEGYSYARLMMKKEEITDIPFEVEYQLTPIRTADQFFSRADILNVTEEVLEPWDLSIPFTQSNLATYGGCDVGKHVHPSHVVIFLEMPSGTLMQLYQTFLDHMDYNEQVDKLNEVAVVFNLTRGYYDSTFNALEDRGLHRAWNGKPFNRKLKANMATLLERRVKAPMHKPGIILMHDPRQLNQIIIVDRELKAATSVHGHGDAFWSNSLAVQAAEDGPTVQEMGSPTVIGSKIYSPGTRWATQLGAR